MANLGEFTGMSAEEAIAAAAKKYSNRGKWGPDDEIGAANFITPQKVAAAAKLVRQGKTFGLAFAFDSSGPQTGQFGRHNPIHMMAFSGSDTIAGSFPLPHGFGAADDNVWMPLQCGTQWDSLAHIFDHGEMWNGYSCALVNSFGAGKCGIQTLREKLVSRGVLLDVPRAKGTDVLEDGYAITAADLDETIAKQGKTSTVQAGDIVLVRTGQLGKRRAEGWGDYCGGAAAGLSFTTLGWLHKAQVTAVATDTWGVEVKPNELPHSFQPFHQVAIPHMGLILGEMWDLDALAADCAADGAYEFQLVAQPLPFTGGIGSPVNPIAIK